MNKREVNEIKKNFSDDNGLFTINQVVSAFISSDKQVKFKSNRFYPLIEQDEAECLMTTLKKVLSGTVGKNLLEYPFPNEMYEEEGSQYVLYNAMKTRLKEEKEVDAVIERIVNGYSNPSTYAIFLASCTYTVKTKNKLGEKTEKAEYDYNFIICALCDVEIREEGLVYDDQTNTIIRKPSSDRVVSKIPTNGFLYPAFNDRGSDINRVMFYTKAPKKPNISVVTDVLGCEFVFSPKDEADTFQDILTNVVADELDYNVITEVNKKVQAVVDENTEDTEIPVIDDIKLRDILIDAGVSDEKLENLQTVYETMAGGRPLTAINCVSNKTVFQLPSVTVNITKEGVNKVHTRTIDGVSSLVIDIDDPSVIINGLPATVK